MVGAERQLPDAELGAAQADRGGVLHGEAHRLGGGAEAARSLRKRGRRVAAEEKLPGGFENVIVHIRVFLARTHVPVGASNGARVAMAGWNR